MRGRRPKKRKLTALNFCYQTRTSLGVLNISSFNPHKTPKKIGNTIPALQMRKYKSRIQPPYKVAQLVSGGICCTAQI